MENKNISSSISTQNRNLGFYGSIAAGLGLGFGLSMMLWAILNNLALGLVIGMLVGALIGLGISRVKGSEQQVM
jgi:hypothetical protein